VKKALPWLLLALSVGANAAFLAGFWVADRREDQARESPEARAALVAEELDLTAEQLLQFTEMRRGLREALWELKRANRPARDRWLDAVLASPPQPAALETALTAIAGSRTESMRLVSGRIQAFAQTLTPEQREKARELLLRRHPMRALFN